MNPEAKAISWLSWPAWLVWQTLPNVVSRFFIDCQEPYDKTVMRSRMRRVTKTVIGKTKAKEDEASDDWFDAASGRAR